MFDMSKYEEIAATEFGGDLDAASMAFGFKIGDVNRPSRFPEFWNAEQAEAWAAETFGEAVTA